MISLQHQTSRPSRHTTIRRCIMIFQGLVYILYISMFSFKRRRFRSAGRNQSPECNMVARHQVCHLQLFAVFISSLDTVTHACLLCITYFCLMGQKDNPASLLELYCQASASRKLTPASAFRHPGFQSGTGLKNAGLHQLSPIPDLSRHRQFCSFRCRTDRMPDSPAFQHFYIQYICTCSTYMHTDMQHEHKHAAWTQPWTIDMDIHHGKGHAAQTLTWTCSMDIDMDMQH